jgi:hypothetical protein
VSRFPRPDERELAAAQLVVHRSAGALGELLGAFLEFGDQGDEFMIGESAQPIVLAQFFFLS